MKFTADLHIHSKYSRATAKNLDFENLYLAAQLKGLSVVGTGDFTYPDWIDEIESKLEEAEPGLFILKHDIAREIDKSVPESCRNPVRFILQTEISNIYKKDGRVRKNHNLIYFPDIKSVKKFNARLETIGNIKSDGRPILGLDAADLLAIMLDINDQGFFIPAHIWTPWFSLFGSKSGFDSLEECFGDLKKYIFAVETGLSSDPPMNWRVKDLDNIRLISNSDAHSPGYLGRNASVFNTELSFAHIRKALEENDLKAFQGTLDMYPHHGKYHYDGHRKCNVCLNPATTAGLDAVCPECGGKLTLGVLYRVQELATRPEGYQPDNRHGYKSIIPLTDILSEIFRVGPKTKKVAGYYNKAIESLGPELDILVEKSIEEIRQINIPLLAEAVEKMRSGDVRIDPGYDGEFGKVNLFSDREREKLQGQLYPLFDLPVKKTRKKKTKKQKEPSTDNGNLKIAIPAADEKEPELLESLNPEQNKAVESDAGAMIIQAGPGTGKTRTLTARIAHLIANKGVDPSSVLALTFTNKAADELGQRIEKYLPNKKNRKKIKKEQSVLSATFHALCLKILKDHSGFQGSIADESLQSELLKKAAGKGVKKADALKAGYAISLCKQRLIGPEDDLSAVDDLPDEFREIYKRYQDLCIQENVVDFEDLIVLTIDLLNKDKSILEKLQGQYRYIFIDEYQDLNYGQYELVKLISGSNSIFVIGDPDQSIYAFRGSDNKYFKSFEQDFPGAEKIILTKNYRSTQTILDASFQMISKAEDNEESVQVYSDDKSFRRLIIKETASEYGEAVAIGKMIEQLVGGTSFFSMDAGKAGQEDSKEYSFSDFAILIRTKAQAAAIIKIFDQEGIPLQTLDHKAWLEMEHIKPLLSLCRAVVLKSCSRDVEVVSDWLAMEPDSSQFFEFKSGLNGLDNTELIKKISEKAGLDKKISSHIPSQEAFEKLLSIAGAYDNLPDFLDGIALNQDTDSMTFEVEKVSLMTLHASKGLEFPVVFVAGCEQGLIPYSRDGNYVANPEEERRLFYVGMTRAMDILSLTYAKKRSIYGITQKRHRSFFIDDIEKQLLKVEKKAFPLPKKKKAKQMELF